MEFAKQVKNNKLSYEAVIKQVDIMFPAEMRDAVKAAATSCKEIGKSFWYILFTMKIFANSYSSKDRTGFYLLFI